MNSPHNIINFNRRRSYQEAAREQRDCQQEATRAELSPVDPATLNDRRETVKNSLHAAIRHAYEKLGMSACGLVQWVHSDVHQEQLRK